MGNNSGGRKILWWSLPISADDSDEVGRRMIRTIIVWFGVIVVLAAIVGVVLAIT